MQSIGNKAFTGCTNLTSVTINSNAVASATYSYDNNFLSMFGNQVTTYTLGTNVTAIGCIRLPGLHRLNRTDCKPHDAAYHHRQYILQRPHRHPCVCA